MAITIPFDNTLFGYNSHIGDGVETDFGVGFPYLNKSSVQNGSVPPFVRVYLNGVEQFAPSWSVFIQGNIVRFAVAPPALVKIEITEEGLINAPAVQWSNQSPINQKNLQKEQNWNKFIHQENRLRILQALDTALAAVGADGNTILNGFGTPSDLLGVNGDFYMDLEFSPDSIGLWGPKDAGTWVGTGPVELVNDFNAGPSGYVLVDDADEHGGAKFVIADHSDRVPAGDARGTSAVDLQTSRSLVSFVAFGDKSSLGGGENNRAANEYSTIPGGRRAESRRRGEMAYGGATDAEAQSVHNVATAFTDDDVPTELGYSSDSGTWDNTVVDGATIPFPEAGVYILSFHGTVVGMRSDDPAGTAAAFQITGALKRDDGGSVAFMGAPVVISLGRDDPGLFCEIVLAPADAGASVKVTGLLGEEYKWHFSWNGSEVLV